jgi:hypothetical protein
MAKMSYGYWVVATWADKRYASLCKEFTEYSWIIRDLLLTEYLQLPRLDQDIRPKLKVERGAQAYRGSHSMQPGEASLAARQDTA